MTPERERQIRSAWKSRGESTAWAVLPDMEEDICVFRFQLTDPPPVDWGAVVAPQNLSVELVIASATLVGRCTLPLFRTFQIECEGLDLGRIAGV